MTCALIVAAAAEVDEVVGVVAALAVEGRIVNAPAGLRLVDVKTVGALAAEDRPDRVDVVDEDHVLVVDWTPVNVTVPSVASPPDCLPQPTRICVVRRGRTSGSPAARSGRGCAVPVVLVIWTVLADVHADVVVPPPPPSIVSLPEPPSIVSAAELPWIVSSPASPCSVLTPAFEVSSLKSAVGTAVSEVVFVAVEGVVTGAA